MCPECTDLRVLVIVRAYEIMPETLYDDKVRGRFKMFPRDEMFIGHPRIRRSGERENFGGGKSSSPANILSDIDDNRQLMMSSSSDEPEVVSSEKDVDKYIGRNTFLTSTAHAEFIEHARREQREKQQHYNSYGIFQVCLQMMAFSLLMGYICIGIVMVTLELIRLIGLFPITILIFTGKLTMRKHNSKLVWKYHFWLLVGTILKPNKALALEFADFVRKMIPNLAPCNALHDDVTCTTLTSTFIAKTHEDVKSLMTDMYPRFDIIRDSKYPSLRSSSLVKLDSACRQRIASISNQVFKIGEGYVIVAKRSGVLYRFSCVVRGELLEDFMAITDWRSLAIILRILEFWQISPKVGVIENLTLTSRGGGIYCHALNLKKIVEGAHMSDDYFSFFDLPEEKRFYIGCGTGSMLENQSNVFKWSLGVVFAVIAALMDFFQLKDNYLGIAITGLVILIVAPAIIGFLDLSGPLLMQSSFYWLSTLLCCFNAKWRLGVYICLRKRGSSLAFCDEFNPDELRSVDNKTEVIYLHKSLYKSRKSVAVEGFPDWTSKIDFHKVGTSGVWLYSWTNGNMDIKVKLYILDSKEFHRGTFEMEFTCSNWFTKSRRVVLTRSVDQLPRGNGTVKGKITTEVSLDGEAITYKWSVDSFYLFFYLMLEWGRMNHGVVQNWEDFMFRSYNHVFSVHSLAAHIEKHELISYYLLLPDPQTTQP